ncbi:type VI secretion protein [Caballeronia sp. LjRoot34]|uniref:type VI secretion protein n=1 Tax=Caballeronia sp. LjRoot34 TaxID=3342325 RepID=UPI003ECCFB7D
MLKKTLGRLAAVCVMTLLPLSAAHAWGIVFDPTNFAKNTITAAEAVKSEVYQDTNLIYQYQMMLNQLKQATNLNPAAMLSQAQTISSDLSSLSKYTDGLKSLYGGLQSNAQYLTKVVSLVTQSGKTPQQWLSDQSTLLQNNDTTAKQLFQQGSDVISHVGVLAKRRQEIQDQLNLSPTQEATAQLTTHMLDIVSSQNGDMLTMMAAKQQSEAVDTQAKVADATASNAARATLQSKQDQERAAYQSSIGTSTVLGQ